MEELKGLNHVLPDGFEKYVVLLAKASKEYSPIKIVVRFQKILRLIYDNEIEQLEKQNQELMQNAQKLVEGLEFVKLNLIEELDEPVRQSFWRAVKDLKEWKSKYEDS